MENQQGTSLNFETFTWKIENFLKQNTMDLKSKSFKIQGCKWKIQLHHDVNHFSLYLMVADSLRPYGWDRNTYFKLVLINQVDATKSVVRETQQKFNGGHRSWGSTFLKLKDFLDSEQGYLVNNTCIIQAHICVSDVVVLNTTIQNETLSNVSPTNGSRKGKQEIESSDESERHSSTTSGSDLTLRDILDFEKLENEQKIYVPLLEEVCVYHPSLIRSHEKKSDLFKVWAFISLGKVLHFLNTTKVRDMNEDACNQLCTLWDELKSSQFDLAWLEPQVHNALGVKAQVERTLALKNLENSVIDMEIRMLRLRGELAAIEAEFKVARKALIKTRKDVTDEIDFNAVLGYSMF